MTRLAVLIMLALTWLAAAPGLAAEEDDRAADLLIIDEEAAEKLKEFDRLVERKEWRDAIDICQKLISAPSKGVVQIGPGVYGSVRALCDKKLKELPPPAKLLYRTLHDPEAEKLYKQALWERDLAAARRLVSEFGQTSHGPGGLGLLADLLFDKGDVHGAADAWLRWMDRADLDAAPEAERRLVAVKAAVAAAMAGEKSTLERAVGVFGPKGLVVEAGLARLARSEELEKFAAAVRRQPRGPAEAPAELDLRLWEGSSGARRRTIADWRLARWSGYEARNFTHAPHATVATGRLFIPRPGGVYAFQALTGRPLWKRAVRNYDQDYYRSIRSQHFYCQAYESALAPEKTEVFASGGTRLDVLDAETGRIIWSKNRNSFANVEDIGKAPDQRVVFSSPVLCEGGSAYVVLETTSSRVFLLCMDRSDGAVRWALNIGGVIQEEDSRVSVPSSLALVGGDLVFCSGHGIIGRCDAATGEVKWLASYGGRSGRGGREQRYNQSIAYVHSPIVCEGDAVVTAPSDSRELIAVRLSDGTPLWRRQLDEARRLLGALGPSAEGGPNRLFVAGAEIQCLNADNGSILWTWPIPDPPAGGPSVHVTGTSILVASGKWLYILDPAGGELLRFQEVEGLDAGAVDAAFDRDCLALVSAEKVVALGGRVRAGELVEQAPPDAWTTAVRARLLRREGRQGDALARLAEAVALADKSPSGKSVARQLEREMVDLYHELHLAERKAGRNIEAFQWMAKALQAAGDTEYECKLGYRRDTGRDPSEPHVLRLTAGDLLSGKLVGLESGMVTFLVRGEAWQIAAPGVREIYLGSTARPAESIESGASHLLLRNGDRISCRVVCLRDDELTVRAAFGEFQAKLADISVIALGGAGIPAAGAVCVKLRNGDLLSGELIAFDGNEVVLGVPFCGKRRIPVAEIYAISNRRALPRQTLTGEEGAEGLDTLIRGPGDFGF